MSPKQLKPLVQDTTTNAELRELLGEAASQSMPRHRAEKLAAELASTTGASLSISSVASQTTVATKSSALVFASSAAAKAVVGVALVATTIGVGFAWTSASDNKRHEEPRARVMPTPAPVAQPTQSPIPESPSPAFTSAPRSERETSRPRAASSASGNRERGPAPGVEISATPGPETPTMSEVAMLGEAQRLLATSPQDAFLLTERANARYPNGVFVQEREVIAIDALLRGSRRTEAEARAQNFLRSYPSSSYARRIRVLLGESD